jgi:hypothetical protein
LFLLVAVGCSGPHDGTLSASPDTNFRGWWDKSQGPCADGGWGHINPSKPAIHVRTDGSDATGDGSAGAPLHTLDQAIELVYAGWPTKHIALGPGTFEASLELTNGSGRSKLNALSIEGCSADETVLQAASDASSILEVSEAKAVRITGVTLEGGRRALRVRDGAQVRLHHSRIEGSSLVGALVQDRKSQLFMRNTQIWDTAPEGNIGWGVAVLDGKLHMTNSSIHNSTEMGLFADAAALELTDIEVHDTLPSGRFNALGRGIHVQQGSEITMTGGFLQNNADAGIFLLDVAKATIDGVMIDITSAGIVIDFPSTGFSGDGIVVYGGQDISLYGNLVSGSARAALLFDAADVLVEGNQTWDNGLVIRGFSMFAQENAQAFGQDAGDVLDLRAGLLLNDWAVDGEGVSDDD